MAKLAAGAAQPLVVVLLWVYYSAEIRRGAGAVPTEAVSCTRGGSLAGGTICAPEEHASQMYPLSRAAIQFSAPLVFANKGHQSVEDSWHGAGDYHDADASASYPRQCWLPDRPPKT